MMTMIHTLLQRACGLNQTKQLLMVLVRFDASVRGQPLETRSTQKETTDRTQQTKKHTFFEAWCNMSEYQ